MKQIRVHRHAAEGEPPQVYQAESIGAWLVEHYGPAAPEQGVYVYAGEPSAQTDLTGDVPALLRNDAPLYVVLETPGEPISLTAILINIAVATAISFVASVIFAPDDKSLANRTQESPNNQLAGRENRVRLLERVEDIFGTVRSIPSLLMQTYMKWVANRRVEYSLACVGRGHYLIEDVRDGDTPLDHIEGASAAIYGPFTSPNSGTPQATIGDAIIDTVLTVSRSSSVESITLKAANQLQLSADQTYLFRGPGPVDGVLPDTTEDLIFQPDESRRPNVAAVAEIGQTLTIAMDDTEQTRTGGVIDVDGPTKTYTSSETGFFRGLVDGSTMTVNGAGFTNPGANTGVKTVVSHTGETVTVAEALGTEAAVGGAEFVMDVNYSGTRVIADVQSGYVTMTGGPDFYPTVSETFAGVTITADNGLTDWTGWINVTSPDRTQLWTNVAALRGMYKDDGSKQGTSVAYELQIEQLDALLAPTGVVETVTGSISGATSTERGETLERVTGWTGPARVRMRRTTPFDYLFAGAVIDEITWEDLYEVSPVDKPHFGNKTIIHTVTRATPSATAVRRRELNCLASRLLPTYDGVAFSGAFDADGAIASGTINPTSRMVDILAAVTVDPWIGARDISEIDLAQIWATQQALDGWNSECGQFNYTFDADSISYEETVDAIANAVFCQPYRQNGQIRLSLDYAQADSVALFSHRNKAPGQETISRRFASDSDYDGVELVYADPDTETQETIRLPLAGGFTKLKKVEVSGIRSFAQAWFRANREYQRLRFERLSIETQTTADARALLPNSRVDIVDNTRFKSFDGEVIAQDGLELTLSRDVEFVPAEPHSIVLQKRDGGIQSIGVTAGSAANRVVLAAPPAEALVTTPDPDDGIRTIFSFAADSARAAQAWLVQEIALSEGGYVRVRAVNYSDAYYEADSLPVPDKASVIN